MTDRLISCDDHMDLSQLPADLWTTRLPASLLDRAPHVEERDGQAVWVCDGKVWGRWDGKPPATGSARPIKALYNAFDRAGIHDASARRPAVAELRLADMDRDGVATQVIFGPIFQISTEDPVLRTACYRVYNDWLLDFCKAAPDRLIGLPMLPETPDGALAELERLRAKGGVRQVNLMIANVNPKLDDPAWEPLWQALEESGIILSWHITVFVGKPGDRVAGKAASVFENTKFFLANFLEPFVDLFAWGILERHPEIAHGDGRGRHGMAPVARRGARLPPLAALGSEGVLGRQGRQRPRHEAERALQAADLRDLPGRSRGDVAHSVLWRRPPAVGVGLSRTPTASGPTPDKRSSGRCGTCRRRCAAS
jgi:hypothetical protein